MTAGIVLFDISCTEGARNVDFHNVGGLLLRGLLPPRAAAHGRDVVLVFRE